MKTLSFFLLTMFLTSCASYFYTSYSTKYTAYDLSRIPSRFEGIPEFFYVNESLPAKPYIETVDMEFTTEHSAVDGKTLIETLQKMAIKEKVNGVIVLNSAQVSFRDGANPYGAGVRGIGFVYLENIDYLNQFIKHEELLVIPDTSSVPQLAALVDYFPNGAEKSLQSRLPHAEQLYETYIKQFSEYHLLKENENWLEDYSGDKLASRKLTRYGDWIIKSVAIDYRTSKRDQLARLTIISDELRTSVNYVVDYIYDKKNRLKERIIRRNGYGYFMEKLFYDGQDRLIAKDYYLYEDKREKHFLKSIYSHYFNTDLPALLEQDSMFVVRPAVQPK